MAEGRKRLCNQDCSNCSIVENQQLAVLLNVLALKFGEEVWNITNRVCANMTCCPICGTDDFCHACADAKSGIAAIDEIGEDNESCEVAEMAKEIFKEFNKQEEKKPMTCSTPHSFPQNPTTSTSTAKDSSLYALAEEKLREKVQNGDLEAIALVLKLQPNKLEVTC